MAVDAVMSLEDDLNLKMIGVKKVPGGSLTDSVLIKGVAFKKTFSYAGFEQQVRVIRTAWWTHAFLVVTMRVVRSPKSSRTP